MVRITDETLPIICFQSYGKSTAADIASIRPIYQRAYARGRPVICLSDARFAVHSADQRRLWAEWLEETKQSDVKECAVATVILLDSALLRSALIALNWLTPARTPQHVVANAAEAIEELRVLTQRFDMTVPMPVWGQIRMWIHAGDVHRTG